MSYAGATDPNLVSIVVGGQRLSGWQDVRIQRSLESVPPTFDLGLTERYPGEAGQIVIEPGDPCQIMLGADVVLTGYVDRYTASISPDQHNIRISGRGTCQDLVDCSAKTEGYQLNNHTLVGIAKKLCQPFGIQVKAPDGDGAVVPQFNIILTETPYEVIERIARWANFLVYEDTDGSLVIARVGDAEMASGFALGSNIQAADASFSMDNRYTEIGAVFTSTAFLNDPPPMPGALGPVIQFVPGSQVFDKSFPVRADGQPRMRPLIIVSEQTQNDPKIAAARARWDMARRFGRSQQVNVTCDSWRDSDGGLWELNALAPLNMPALKLTNQTWLISSVTFVRNEDGTTAELTLMPKEAFVPEAEYLVRFNWQVGQDIPGGSTNYAPALR